jgi:hypothetical protein
VPGIRYDTDEALDAAVYTLLRDIALEAKAINAFRRI